MTILDAPPRVDSLEDLELDFGLDATPQCEIPYHREEYDPEAKYKAVIHCPNKHGMLACQQCKDENESAWNKRKGVYLFKPMICTICQGHVPSADPFHWEEL